MMLLTDNRGAKMKINRSLLGCVLLVMCVDAAIAQAAVSSTPAEAQRRQLSLQQQSNILSDIQQHQHRFDLRQNPFNTAFSLNLQQLQNQPWVNQQIQFPGQNLDQRQYLQKQPLIHSQLLQQQIQNQNPAFPQTALGSSVLQNPLLSSPNIPIFQTPNNPSVPHVQHHTQTSFTPNFNQQPNNFPTAQLQARPTSEPVFTRPTTTVNPEKEKERLKQLKEKQAIIDKHNQFIEKQYEKSLKKAQEDHVEWVEKQKEKKAKLYQKLYKLPKNQETSYSHAIPRYIYPEEAHLFELAVKKYYEEHPTTTTTTTSTTTETPDDSEEEEEDKIDRSSTKKTTFLPTVVPASNPIQTLDDLNTLKKQYREKQIGKDDLLAQLRLAIANEGDNDLTKNISSREISLGGKRVQVISTTDSKLFEKSKPQEITLPNGQTVEVIRTSDPSMVPGNNPLKPDEITLPSGQKVQVIRTTDPNLIPQDSIKSQEITLPNGQRVEIIRTTDPKLVPGGTPLEPGSDLEKLVLSRTTTTTTIKPPKVFFDEIAKDVIPKGSNFELLKTGASGGLEQIESPSNLPDKKKVTFVLLEEQADGTLKVQGIKGTGKDKPEVDVDSILKKIRNGEIKLPTSSPKPESTTTAPSTTPVPSTTQASFGAKLVTEESSTPKVSVLPNSFATSEDESPVVKTKMGTEFVSTSTASSTYYTDDFSRFSSSLPTDSPTTARSSRQPHILNHGSTAPPNDLVRQESSSSAQNSQNSIFSNSFSSSRGTTFLPRTTTPSYPSEIIPSISETVTPVSDQPSRKYSKEPSPELVDILKKQGLFAMAKFLKQSGLDTILNETGPYTIFVPNDKAFRTLLVQLGGPERAEQKFKDNPRLLSGLLLHHVIPGAFTIASLQDEMTGVSLAGTQLRVNQYNMQDAEWNDIKLTTINGAKVLDDKKDIEIPQGMAHAVDRVMFPLPVGDIVQTLQSDRERRFTNFLRALFAGGLADSLQGTKTFTLFAPTDKAFVGLSSEDLGRMISDKKLARELVLRHLIAGTLYTNGMRYFQIKESLQPDRQITINKQSGKLKINNNYLATQNIPATNGVIHAIDTLL
ncbi:uncharacterized protein LOC123312170 [Coccinella septempunctata]|uniref:uncharacterized protein LOC123312170 n=1 Tax=Coccinella septempunctata TaxID=41139 RepID=UPI001D07B2C5|nr:uncharacterized protein LOC123312170 [Coccinella septempunctata]